jgi:hypothetical protein
LLKQVGRCAFARSCINSGPYVRLAGTNRSFCPPHMRIVELPSKATAELLDRAAVTVRTAKSELAAVSAGLVAKR